MTTEAKLLAAIRELIETIDGEKEWSDVVEKHPEIATQEAVETMEKIVKRFDAETLGEIIQHWQARIDFLKKRYRT